MAAETLTITTIADYFSRDYNINVLRYKLNNKLFSYTGREYPLAICLSSNFEDGTLLGTLNFQELDIDGYPIYTGNVVKRSSNLEVPNINYSALLSHSNDKGDSIYIIRLGAENELDIRFRSSITTSLNPTSVSYDGISNLTPGSCKI